MAGCRRRGGGSQLRIALLLLSWAMAATPSVTALAQSAPTISVPSADSYADFVTEASQRFGIPVAWIRAVMRVESRGEVRAISPAGAMGLMQIMPDTWAALRIRHRLGNDPYDPHDNILAGAAYLREMHDRYGSPGFLAAYNAGPGRYEEYLASGRALPAETRAYVATLAPLVGGGEIAGPTVVAAADPLSWTRAPLFIAHVERTSSTIPAQADERVDNTPAAVSAREVSIVTPQSAGLFVARSDAGGPR